MFDKTDDMRWTEWKLQLVPELGKGQPQLVLSIILYNTYFYKFNLMDMCKLAAGGRLEDKWRPAKLLLN